MATFSQIQKIHIAKKDLSLTDDNYKAILSGFDKTSSTELSFWQAEDLLGVLKKMGWQPMPKKVKDGKHYIKITVPANRSREFAEEKQLKMLAGLWVQRSREKDEKSFNNFICRIAAVSHYSFLQKASVQKLKKAMENI